MRWDIHGIDYLLWRRLTELTGDRPMGVRLDAIHAARQSGCKTALALKDGTVSRVPLMMVAEAAVAAHQGKRESEWREEWIRGMLQMARDLPDGPELDRLVSALDALDAVTLDMRDARVWPWMGRPSATGKRMVQSTESQEGEDADG